MENNRERLDIKSTRQTFYAGETDFFDVQFNDGTHSSDGTQYTITNFGRMNFKIDFSAFHKYASIKSVKIRVKATYTGEFEVRAESALNSNLGNTSLSFGGGQDGWYDVELVGCCNESFTNCEYKSLYFKTSTVLYTASAAKEYQPQLIIC